MSWPLGQPPSQPNLVPASSSSLLRGRARAQEGRVLSLSHFGTNSSSKIKHAHTGPSKTSPPRDSVILKFMMMENERPISWSGTPKFGARPTARPSNHPATPLSIALSRFRIFPAPNSLPFPAKRGKLHSHLGVRYDSRLASLWTIYNREPLELEIPQAIEKKRRRIVRLANFEPNGYLGICPSASQRGNGPRSVTRSIRRLFFSFLTETGSQTEIAVTRSKQTTGNTLTGTRI
jgi:hypothetical protein